MSNAVMEANALKNNLYEIIAKELVSCEVPELYLFAGMDFVASIETPAIRAAIDEAKTAYNCPAEGILVAHYHMGPFPADVMFKDGARGVLSHNNVSVQFEIKVLSAKPRISRVLFQRIDAEKLMTETKEKLEDLNRRVQVLERRTS
jgi:hypothetical protein